MESVQDSRVEHKIESGEERGVKCGMWSVEHGEWMEW